MVAGTVAARAEGGAAARPRCGASSTAFPPKTCRVSSWVVAAEGVAPQPQREVRGTGATRSKAAGRWPSLARAGPATPPRAARAAKSSRRCKSPHSLRWAARRECGMLHVPRAVGQERHGCSWTSSRRRWRSRQFRLCSWWRRRWRLRSRQRRWRRRRWHGRVPRQRELPPTSSQGQRRRRIWRALLYQLDLGRAVDWAVVRRGLRRGQDPHAHGGWVLLLVLWPCGELTVNSKQGSASLSLLPPPTSVRSGDPNSSTQQQQQQQQPAGSPTAIIKASE